MWERTTFAAASIAASADFDLGDKHKSITALESGILGGAGLDTIAPEPVLKDNPVVNAKPEILDKLVISPHIGGLTVQTFEKIYNTIWSNFKKVEDGEKPCNIVNV